MKTWIMPQYRPSFVHFASVQFSSVRSLGRLGRRGDLRDDSVEILFQSCLQEALENGSGMGRDAHSLILSTQHFLRLPRRRSPSKVPRRLVLKRMSWCVTCPNHASFHVLAIVRRGSCGPTRKLILLRSQSLVLCSKQEMRRSFLRHLVSNAWIFFSESASRIHVSQPWRRMEVTLFCSNITFAVGCALNTK